MSGSDSGTPPDDLQHVRIDRSGGLAGLRASCDLEGRTLSAAQRQAVIHMLAAQRPAPTPGADRFRFRVDVTHGDGRHTVIDVGEDAMPDALARLVKPALP